MSGHTIEDVKAAAGGPAWFQLYFLGGRAGAEQLIDRAQKAGYTTLVVTIDTQIPGNREREQRHGVHLPLQMSLSNAVRFAPQVAPHPGWLSDFARDGFSLELANAASLGTPERPMSSRDALMYWLTSPPRWEDFAWIRERWPGPVVAKGIVTGEDARRAVDSGVEGIIVSNHGGRQLDGIRATMPALVEVVEAVGGEVEVLVDGGIRRGADVVRAVALGAQAAMVGRPWAYGLAAAGEAGIVRVLEILREDIDRTLRLVGCASIDEAKRDLVEFPDAWRQRTHQNPSGR
jgi:isopentenyl diphosphate isomerase/L-lactate dehydrogenase-like FMN-dependent dehydrogenase